MRLRMLEDRQAEIPLGECSECGMELYSEEEAEICVSCREKLNINRWHHDTAEAVADAFDTELQKYLSDDLRDAIWNEATKRFGLNA